MRNHFGNGLKAGLKTTDACMAFMSGRFCSEYSKGYVLGYCYQIVKKTGDSKSAAWEAGRLTRRYQLDSEVMAEFFSEHKSDETIRCFFMGYEVG